MVGSRKSSSVCSSGVSRKTSSQSQADSGIGGGLNSVMVDIDIGERLADFAEDEKTAFSKAGNPADAAADKPGKTPVQYQMKRRLVLPLRLLFQFKTR